MWTARENFNLSLLRFLCLALFATTIGCLDPADIVESKPSGDKAKQVEGTSASLPDSAANGSDEGSGESDSPPSSAESLMTAITESHEKMADTLAKMVDVDSAHAHMNQYKSLLKEQMRYMEQVKRRPELSDKYGGHQFVQDPDRRNKAVARHSAEKGRIRFSAEMKPILEQAFQDLNYNEWFRKLEGIPDFGARPKAN